MRISRSGAGIAAVAAAAALLAGCNGAPQSSALAPAGNPGLSPSHSHIPPSIAAAKTGRIHRDAGRSWISPDIARAPRLLFITDYGSDSIYIFTMPALVLKATLTGLSFPEGACEDASGNIWVANAGASQLIQYSRTGTQLKTLSTPGFYPAGCAVNWKNNDLAVANIESTTAGPGNITIFTNASGSGTAYTDPNIAQYFFVGWDPSGNLFYDGENNASRTAAYFGELPAGSSTPKTITLSGATLHFAGFVQWFKGGYVALGDQMCGGTSSACVYWISVSGSTGTNLGTTNLSNYEGGAVCDLVQGVIAANGQRYVAGADYEGTCGNTVTTANRWPYESGDTPTNYNNTNSAFVEPLGAAVSAK
jgi:hypothetical protein